MKLVEDRGLNIYFALKICLCLWSDRIGGIQKIVSLLANEISAKYQLSLVFGKSGANRNSFSEINPDQILTLNFKSGFDLRLKKFKRARAHFQMYDVVHVHSFNPILIWAAIRSNAKVIYTFHSLPSLRRKPSFADKLNRYILNRFLAKRISVFTTVSEFARKKIQKEYTSIKQIIVIHNFCEEFKGNFKPKTYCPNKPLRILSYGRLVDHKRFHYLIDLAEKLVTKNFDFQLTILGEGPEKVNLTNLLSQKKLNSKISILPFSNNIFEYLSEAHLCIFPFHAESFGLVVLEALQCSTPVLVMNDGGGLTEILDGIDKYDNFIATDLNDLMVKVTNWKSIIETDGFPVKAMKQQYMQFNKLNTVRSYISLYEA